MKWLLRILAGLMCAAVLAGVVSAEAAGSPEGFCLTGLPSGCPGSLMLDGRVLRPGDVLTGEQAAQMTFAAEADTDAEQVTVCCLPILDGCVGSEMTMAVPVRRRENRPPVAEDSALETYKNLEVQGKLRLKEPEEEAMTITVTRLPRRGTVTVEPDGSFVYTPKKNKVGIDSFTYTAADPGGHISREATVTVTIRKPGGEPYTDTAGQDCRFAAEWMKNTGIFCGEQVDGNPCFCPERTVGQGEFLAMLVRTLEIPTEPEADPQRFAEAPAWLRPYLAAAVRAGLTAGADLEEPEQPMTAQTAAVLLCNALDLDLPALSDSLTAGQAAAQCLAQQEFTLPEDILTRADAAQLLYRLACSLRERPLLQIWQK